MYSGFCAAHIILPVLAIFRPSVLLILPVLAIFWPPVLQYSQHSEYDMYSIRPSILGSMKCTGSICERFISAYCRPQLFSHSGSSAQRKSVIYGRRRAWVIIPVLFCITDDKQTRNVPVRIMEATSTAVRMIESAACQGGVWIEDRF